MYKKGRKQRGITLIALVVTIIVMLILVGVTISMAINGGLFEQAGKAASGTNESLKAEEELSKGKIQVGEEVYNSIEEYVNKYKGDNVEKISKGTSYVGYYADVNGDKIADGVIYADLAIGVEGELSGYSYSYNAVPATELKDYYVSGSHDGDFGNGKGVLTATGEGKDRFYVIALSDISDISTDTYFYSWYYSKEIDGVTICTSEDFGTGKTNTDAIIGIWNADTDEAKSSSDVWGNIQTQVNNGWFLPSKAEMIESLKELGDYFLPRVVLSC